MIESNNNEAPDGNNNISLLQNDDEEHSSKKQLRKRRREQKTLEFKKRRTELRKEKKLRLRKKHAENKLKETSLIVNDQTTVSEETKESLLLSEIKSSSDEVHSKSNVLNATNDCERISRSIQRRKEFEERCRDHPTLIIDCGFEELQDTREITSLSQQIMYCYGANRRATYPCSMICCGLYPELYKRLETTNAFSWAACDLTNQSCNDYLKDKVHSYPTNIVYLTADSEYTLDDMSNNDFYIIGGLVDRNRYSGLTQQRATSWGIKTAKLPIEDHCKITGSKILTVDQVFGNKKLETRHFYWDPPT